MSSRFYTVVGQKPWPRQGAVATPTAGPGTRALLLGRASRKGPASGPGPVSALRPGAGNLRVIASGGAPATARAARRGDTAR